MAKLQISNDSKIKLDKKILNALRKRICKQKDVELLIISDANIKELNKQHRKKNKPTDVLSFPSDYEFANFAGSLAISYETAARQAAEYAHDVQTEIYILFIHGALHLMGYDHETDGGKMRELENAVCTEFGLPSQLISRNIDICQQNNR